MRIRRGVAAWISCAAVFVAPAITMAQGQTVNVRGVAYDSLRREPLADALITVDDGMHVAMADARGRFRIDSLSAGPHRFSMQHAALDSLGLSGISARISVTDGRDEIQLAVPSFASLWRAACGASKPPKDSGFVYGTIRDARARDPVANATVDLTWIDLGVNNKKSISQRRWHNTVNADASGSYAVCGVPANTEMRIRANADAVASGLIDLHARASRIQRRDLLLGVGSGADSSQRGSVHGRLVAAGGGPIANARIIMDEAPEIHSDSDGTFTLRRVPAGTRQIEILSIGMEPVVVPVDIVAGETATVEPEFHKVNTLDAVKITSVVQQRRARELEERRTVGLGHILDSTVIGLHGKFAGVFADVPGLHIKYPGSARNTFSVYMSNATGPGQCLANLFIDGIRQLDQVELEFLHTDEIALVEVYAHGMSVPNEFAVPKSLCGVIAIWTKRAWK